MSDYDLSLLIPARNEQFLAQTVENILQNKKGKTEIIVGLDGQWANPPLQDHPDVTIFYSPIPLGQRGITNQCARLSKAKYVAKVDAHCAFDEGFDVKLMADMQDNWTILPIMYNLHAFDWVCQCGNRRYQGPTKPCEKCGAEMKREIIWKPRWSRQSTAYRFNKDLRFQYWGAYKARQQGDLGETMTILGAFFMLTREKYWELDICDEKHGGWGQQGVEVALKTWLSGGKVITNKKTWFAHMFRTQGGDFSFPYPISGKEVEKARQFSRDLFLNDKWEKAIYPLSWLIEKFKPIPEWHDVSQDEPKEIKVENQPQTLKGLRKEILFYTDNQLNLKIARACQKQLKKAGLPIISVSLKPMPHFGKNIHLKLKRGYLTMAKQILAGLEASQADIVFLAEHDVLYHPSHFDFIPPEKNTFYYNENVWFLRVSDGHCLHYDVQQLSGLCAYRDILITHFKERVQMIEKEGFSRVMGFEPMTHGRIKWENIYKCESWKSKFPNIDIRHADNTTGQRWKKEQFRNQHYTKGWIETDKQIEGWNVIDILKIFK